MEVLVDVDLPLRMAVIGGILEMKSCAAIVLDCLLMWWIMIFVCGVYLWMKIERLKLRKKIKYR